MHRGRHIRPHESHAQEDNDFGNANASQNSSLTQHSPWPHRPEVATQAFDKGVSPHRKPVEQRPQGV